MWVYKLSRTLFRLPLTGRSCALRMLLVPHHHDGRVRLSSHVMNCVSKGKSTLTRDSDALKDKNIEEVLAKIKMKKPTSDADVGSARKELPICKVIGLPTTDQEVDDDDIDEHEAEDEEEDEEEMEKDDKQQEEEERQNRHVTYGYHLVRGKMDHGMEDYVVAKTRNVDGNQLGLYAIFDGHCGRDVAEYLQRHLFNNILKQDDFWTDPVSAVKRAYKATNDDILNVVGSRGGSTAVTAILINKQKLIVANVGDSRGVLCKRREVVKQVTVDHDPEKEKELVESRGGVVTHDKGNVPRVDGQLAMTRAFGDAKVKEHITAEPDVRVEKIDEDSKAIILASDGVWKVLTNEDALDCIEDTEGAQEAAERLVTEALVKGSHDDISCIVVKFQH